MTDHLKRTRAYPYGVFPARYPGECQADCGHLIKEGQEIMKASSGKGYVHVECPEPLEVKTRFQGTTLEQMGF